jgi:signal transduction histidine kinase
LGSPPRVRAHHGRRATDADRIFDRFYRGRNSAAATGTGLGLAIARWVAEQHGGRIDLTTSSTGSRFTATLPLAATPPENAPPLAVDHHAGRSRQSNSGRG